MDVCLFIFGIKDASCARFNIYVAKEITFLFQVKWGEKICGIVVRKNWVFNKGVYHTSSSRQGFDCNRGENNTLVKNGIKDILYQRMLESIISTGCSLITMLQLNSRK